jgi:hypothetical protein
MIVYDDGTEELSGAAFEPRCLNCGRFVKPRPKIGIGQRGPAPEPNADCKWCGPVQMPFVGWPV